LVLFQLMLWLVAAVARGRLSVNGTAGPRNDRDLRTGARGLPAKRGT
jgi:hypothetical protein